MAMKKVLLAGIAVLFLATGTVAAVEQNWEMAIVLKEPRQRADALSGHDADARGLLANFE